MSVNDEVGLKLILLFLMHLPKLFYLKKVLKLTDLEIGRRHWRVFKFMISLMILTPHTGK